MSICASASLLHMYVCLCIYVCAGVGIWVGVHKYMPVCTYAEHRELNTGIHLQRIHTHTNTHNTLVGCVTNSS